MGNSRLSISLRRSFCELLREPGSPVPAATGSRFVQWAEIVKNFP